MSSYFLAVLFTLGASQASPAPPPHETLFYTHDGLKLETYLYTPPGGGPFPMVVYNHGSAEPGKERDEWPAPFIARVLVPAGYAVLVPERRGYGKSEGKTFREDIGADRGPRFVERQRAEAGDINAAVDFVLSRPNSKIDAKRIINMGFSFGGIVTALSSATGPRYAAVILQAPGALNWPRSAEMRAALTEAAGKIRVPMLCSVAENDLTTESATTLCSAAAAAGAKTIVKIYPPFVSGKERPGNAPGHALFSPPGLDIWRADLLGFLLSVSQRPHVR